jgi:hypothetical protein
VVAVVGTDIGRVVDAVGSSSMCWILVATSTLDSILAAGSGTMDTADAVGTSSRRAINVAGNAIDVVGTSSSRRVRPGMICIFSNYRLRIKKLLNIGFLAKIVPNLEFTLYFVSFMII